ncbi:hypothetical protein MMPV_005110 [Pyropia vietnamensis]
MDAAAPPRPTPVALGGDDSATENPSTTPSRLPPPPRPSVVLPAPVAALLTAHLGAPAVASLLISLPTPPPTTLRLHPPTSDGIAAAAAAVLDHLAPAAYRLEPTHPSMPEVLRLVPPPLPPSPIATASGGRGGNIDGWVLPGAGVRCDGGDGDGNTSPAAPPPVFLDGRTGEAVLRGAHVYVAGIVGAHPAVRAGEPVTLVVDADAALCEGARSAAATRVRAGGGKRRPRRDGVAEAPLLPPRLLVVGWGVAAFSRRELFGPRRPQGGLGVTVRGVVAGTPHAWSGGPDGGGGGTIHWAPPPPSLHGVLPHQLFLQNLPSATVTHLLGPSPGDTVVDVTASPGGKATHVAALVGPTGRVVAIDRSPAKVAAVTAAAARLGLYSPPLVAVVGDATTRRGVPLPDGSADGVLVDPPCSGLGLRPRLRPLGGGSDAAAELAGAAAHQRRFFGPAVAVLRVGGVLVYSTCTVDPLENEGVVAWALASFPLALEAPPIQRGRGEGASGGRPLTEATWSAAGLTQREGNGGGGNGHRSSRCRLTPADADLCWAWSGASDTPGFFAARFRKVGPWSCPPETEGAAAFDG